MDLISTLRNAAKKKKEDAKAAAEGQETPSGERSPGEEEAPEGSAKEGDPKDDAAPA